MTDRLLIPRRRLLTGAAALAGASLLGGCDRLARDEGATQTVLDLSDAWTYRIQRWLLGADQLAPEYAQADITQSFKPNGTTDPADEDYRRLAAAQFRPYRLVVDGLVETPAHLSLAELRALPARTQITRHDCVEGWSCIGKWKGVPLSAVLDRVRPKPEARLVVFHCADTMSDGGSLDGGPRYYESIDMADARHPQTILAYELNDEPLPVRHGAPLRVRIERQLGYKMAKYVMRIELVDSVARIGGGRGSYWADNGYEWYAGI